MKRMDSSLTVDYVKGLIDSGKCKTFNNWHENAGVSEEDFLKGVEWLIEDSIADYEDGRTRAIKELGCTSDGRMVHLHNNYHHGEYLGTYFNDDTYMPGHIGDDKYLWKRNTLSSLVSVNERTFK